MQFIGIAWTGTDESFQGFIDKHGLTFPQVSDDRGDVFARFEVPGQPAFVLIEADGTVQQILGAVDSELLDSLIGDALA